uniref:hemagglutinin repeat-containing protein n=1 Tax=Mixta calida TaxID=665913 RepID=UPI0028B204A2
ISQFLSGPTGDAKFGNSKESSRQVVSQTSNRGSTLDAGNDSNIVANNDVRIRGGQLQSGRDINIQGRDVTLDAAKGSYGEESSEEKSWSGIHGGTSGGFKLGVGGSRGVADNDQSHLAVSAGRDVTNYGTLQAGRDVALQAGNDMNVLAKTDSSEKHEIFKGGHRSVMTTDAKQMASTVSAGRDLDIQAGRDVNVLASQAKAGHDLRLIAGQDIKNTRPSRVATATSSPHRPSSCQIHCYRWPNILQNLRSSGI